MFNSIIQLIGSAISSSSVWFGILADAMGFISVFIACFSIYTMVRLLLKPLIGSSMGSDSAKKYKKGNK